MVPAYRSVPFERASRLLGAFALLSACAAGTYLLLPDPLADAFFAGWVLVGVGLSLVGAVGAWTNRTPLVWVAALLLTGLSILGLWSLGLFVAPAALLLLGSALCSQLAGPREAALEAIAADPPAASDVALQALVGSGSVVLGAGLVYSGAFARELFEACANETPACAIEATHWDAVGVTALGLVAVGLGGRLVWKQFYVARVLTSRRGG